MEGKVDAAFRSTIASAVHGAAAFLPDGIAVRIAGLTKEFAIGDESVVAVLDLDLSVRDGEFLCIVGPSGCGKTTLIRTVAGLETQTAGTIWVKSPLNGRPLTAMVFQTDSIFPWMTVEDNVGYGLRMQGVAKPEREAKVKSLLRLPAWRSSPKHRTSFQSMRQRVNVARAFAADRILLMDEPFGLLDEQNRMIFKGTNGDMEGQPKDHPFITHSVDERFSWRRILVMTAQL